MLQTQEEKMNPPKDFLEDMEREANRLIDYLDNNNVNPGTAMAIMPKITTTMIFKATTSYSQSMKLVNSLTDMMKRDLQTLWDNHGEEKLAETQKKETVAAN
jgi:hypothetical protein